MNVEDLLRLCTSAVRMSCEILWILKDRIVGTFILNMLKTIATFGDLLR